MATANITRDEAAERSTAVTAQAYRVTVDVSGMQVADPERNFHSTSEVDFLANGPQTHLDIIADEILEAWVDGNELATDGFDGYRLPLPALESGNHTVKVSALGRYSNSGEGLHRFVDPADQKVYLYTQFETADARRMYANFEQPDQKATFQLTVLAPSHWKVFSNSRSVEPVALENDVSRWEYAPTKLLPTYLTALVAGEYHVVDGEIKSESGVLPASVACRESVSKYLDAEAIFTTTQRGFEVFEEAFGVPYAFDSYDQIFVPEFNFGAMENAGCVIFRDEYLFRSRVTARELEARDNTILHELAHMWFGDLVTMRWWDDLWLNESFAEWASHFAADRIAQRYQTGSRPWAGFSNERKSWAYRQDQFSTTHPIAADMSDLEKVQQNFDGITYAKGASVLQLLVSLVGIKSFLAGVGNYFRKHAFGNTTLSDLLVELEEASGRDLSWFSGEWLETAGVNTLYADFELDAEGKFTSFAVIQEAHPNWPTLRNHRLGIGCYHLKEDQLERTSYVECDIKGPRSEVPELIGTSRGDVILLNDGDLTYAKVRLDPDSAEHLTEHIDKLADPLSRAVIWSSYWNAVRDAKVAPQDFVALALRGLPSEQDMTATNAVLAQAQRCSEDFLDPELRGGVNSHLVAGVARLLKNTPPSSDRQLALAKALIRVSRSPEATKLIRGWLDDEEVPEGLAIDTDVRWAITYALAKLGVFTATDVDAELERDATSAGAERAAGARAALPVEELKKQTWETATKDASVPNETHRSICAGFWQLGQEELLRPYADRYLEEAAAISRREGGWESRGYAAIDAVLEYLFPAPLVDEDLIARYETWLADSSPIEQVRRVVSERLDDAKRALACQARSRQAEAQAAARDN